MVLKSEPDPKPDYRSRHRSKRRREFLDVAQGILNAEGEDALTMQRLTEEIGGSIGSVYYYFPTRAALLAALQQEAFATLLDSYLRGRADLEAYLTKAKVPPDVAALAGVLATCVFWVESETSLPAEVELSRRMIVGGTADTDVDDASGVLPTALALLHEGRDRLDAAVAAGAIDEDDNVERSVMLIASMTGFLMVSRLGEWDAELFDGRRLASRFAANTLAGWGADRAKIAAAEAELERFATKGQIAPPVA